MKNDKQQGSIAGAVAMAHYVRAIAPAYGMSVPLILPVAPLHSCDTSSRCRRCAVPIPVGLRSELHELTSTLFRSPVIIHSDHCAHKLLPWFDGSSHFFDELVQS